AEIRKREKASGKHVPIVAMTAHAMKGDKERCLEAGMDSYISKPIRRKELAAVIQQVVEQFLTPRSTGDGPQSEGEAAMDDIFDQEALLEECDGDLDYVARMLEIFDRDIAERMPRLGTAVAAGDCEAVMREAHAVKGGVGNLFAKAAHETAQKLETMGRNRESRGARELFQTLQGELKQLRGALAAMLKEKGG